MRIGTGYDIHRLEAGIPLVLGGVRIPFVRGPVAHSDGDVLVHALIDSLLGALALGDLGTHFPDSDPAYRGISSLVLLERAAEMVRQQGYRVHNLDLVLVAQAPRIAPYAPAMREQIAAALGIAADRVGLKATTAENLGAIGRGEAMAATAVCLLEEDGD